MNYNLVPLQSVSTLSIYYYYFKDRNIRLIRVSLKDRNILIFKCKVINVEICLLYFFAKIWLGNNLTRDVYLRNVYQKMQNDPDKCEIWDQG